MAVRETMDAHIEALVQRRKYGQFFTDDARFSIEGTDQNAMGGDATAQAIRFMHEVAFDARPELKSLLVDGDRAAIEADFVGVHIGEFAGVPATGRSVRVPYSVVYDLKDDAIAALRLYFPMHALLEQLGAAAPAEAVAN